MDASNPRTFELAVAADDVAVPGAGIVASFVPATGGEPPVVALACDPRHDPGRTIRELAPRVDFAPFSTGLSIDAFYHDAGAAGRSDVDRQWYDVLARAVRVAQAMSPFECQAIPTTLLAPEACRAEWQNWQGFITTIQ